MLFGVILHGLVVALTFRAGTTRPYEMMLIVLNWLLDVLYEYWFVGAIINRPQRRAKHHRLRDLKLNEKSPHSM